MSLFLKEEEPAKGFRTLRLLEHRAIKCPLYLFLGSIDLRGQDLR